MCASVAMVTRFTKQQNNIHLFDRTSPSIIFIWSGEVILGLAHVVCIRSIARFIDSDQEAIYQVACSAPLYKFAYCVIYFRT